MDRNTVLAELGARWKKVEEFNENYTGSGITFLLKKLLRYRFVYASYLVARQFNLHTVLIVQTFFGTRLHLPMKDPETLPIRLFGTLTGNEMKLMKFFIRYIKSSDVFYDVGANYGFYSQLVAKLGAKRVFAFEPNTLVLPILKQNALSRTITVIPKAVSDASERKTFHVQINGSANSTLNGNVLGYQGGNFREINIDAMTLDAFIQSHQVPTIIKIDIEGAELLALKGANHLIKRYKPVFTLEVWSGEKGILFSMPAVLYLLDAKYKPFTIDESGELYEMSEVNPMTFENNHAQNLIFIHADYLETFFTRQYENRSI